MLRYRELPTHTTEVLDLTSLTVEELTALVLPFEAAFLDYMTAWTLHGRRRQARRYTTYKNCPLPTAEDRLLFILVYLKQNPTQLLHGRLFGMRQSKATQWIHVLLPVLRNTLRALGDAPSRSMEALSQHLGVAAPPLPREASPAEELRAAPPPVAPLFVMTVPSDPCHAPTTRLNRKRTIAARKSGICSKTSC
jgi:Helix-turn-helix of DDE superfamily endonuclease